MNNISEITRQDILDIIKDGFIVHLDEPAYDSNVGDYIMEYHTRWLGCIPQKRRQICAGTDFLY